MLNVYRWFFRHWDKKVSTKKLIPPSHVPNFFEISFLHEHTFFFKKRQVPNVFVVLPTYYISKTLIACSGNALLKAGKFFDNIPAKNFCKYQRCFNWLSSQVVYKFPKIPSAEILCANKLWMKNLNTAFDNFSENPKVFKDENHLRPISTLSLTSAADLAVLGLFNFSLVVLMVSPIVSSAIFVKLSTVAQHLLLFL